MEEAHIIHDSDSEEEENETSIWARNGEYKRFTHLEEPARAIILQCILSDKKQFPFEAIKTFGETLRKTLKVTYVPSTKVFIWKNVVRWTWVMKQSLQGTPDTDHAERLNFYLTDILAQYVNYKCETSFAKDDTEIENVANEIFTKLWILFHPQIFYIVMTLLKVDVEDNYCKILDPIFKKCLSNKELSKFKDLIKYLGLVLCFRRYKKLFKTKEEKEEINKIAVGKSLKQLRAENTVISSELMSDGILPKFVPKIDKFNQCFTSISGLVKFAADKKNVGTRILLINESLDLDEAVCKYFEQYELHLQRNVEFAAWLKSGFFDSERLTALGDDQQSTTIDLTQTSNERQPNRDILNDKNINVRESSSRRRDAPSMNSQNNLNLSTNRRDRNSNSQSNSSIRNSQNSNSNNRCVLSVDISINVQGDVGVITANNNSRSFEISHVGSSCDCHQCSPTNWHECPNQYIGNNQGYAQYRDSNQGYPPHTYSNCDNQNNGLVNNNNFNTNNNSNVSQYSGYEFVELVNSDDENSPLYSKEPLSLINSNISTPSTNFNSSLPTTENLDYTRNIPKQGSKSDTATELSNSKRELSTPINPIDLSRPIEKNMFNQENLIEKPVIQPKTIELLMNDSQLEGKDKLINKDETLALQTRTTTSINECSFKQAKTTEQQQETALGNERIDILAKKDEMNILESNDSRGDKCHNQTKYDSVKTFTEEKSVIGDENIGNKNPLLKISKDKLLTQPERNEKLIETTKTNMDLQGKSFKKGRRNLNKDEKSACVNKIIEKLRVHTYEKNSNQNNDRTVSVLSDKHDSKQDNKNNEEYSPLQMKFIEQQQAISVTANKSKKIESNSSNKKSLADTNNAGDNTAIVEGHEENSCNQILASSESREKQEGRKFPKEKLDTNNDGHESYDSAQKDRKITPSENKYKDKHQNIESTMSCDNSRLNTNVENLSENKAVNKDNSYLQENEICSIDQIVTTTNDVKKCGNETSLQNAFTDKVMNGKNNKGVIVSQPTKLFEETKEVRGEEQEEAITVEQKGAGKSTIEERKEISIKSFEEKKEANKNIIEVCKEANRNIIVETSKKNVDEAMKEPKRSTIEGRKEEGNKTLEETKETNKNIIEEQNNTNKNAIQRANESRKNLIKETKESRTSIIEEKKGARKDITDERKSANQNITEDKASEKKIDEMQARQETKQVSKKTEEANKNIVEVSKEANKNIFVETKISKKSINDEKKEPSKRTIEEAKVESNKAFEETKETNKNLTEEQKITSKNAIQEANESRKNLIEETKETRSSIIEEQKGTRKDITDEMKSANQNITEEKAIEEIQTRQATKEISKKTFEGKEEVNKNVIEVCKEANWNIIVETLKKIIIEAKKEPKRSTIEGTKEEGNKTLEETKETNKTITEEQKDTSKNAAEKAKESRKHLIEETKESRISLIEEKKGARKDITDKKKSANQNITEDKASEKTIEEIQEGQGTKEITKKTSEEKEEANKTIITVCKEANRNIIEKTTKKSTSEAKKEPKKSTIEVTKEESNKTFEETKETNKNITEEQKDASTKAAQGLKDLIEETKESRMSLIEENKGTSKDITDKRKSANQNITEDKAFEKTIEEIQEGQEINKKTFEEKEEVNKNIIEVCKEANRNIILETKKKSINDEKKESKRSTIEVSKEESKKTLEETKETNKNITEERKDASKNAIQGTKELKNLSEETTESQMSLIEENKGTSKDITDERKSANRNITEECEKAGEIMIEEIQEGQESIIENRAPRKSITAEKKEASKTRIDERKEASKNQTEVWKDSIQNIVSASKNIIHERKAAKNSITREKKEENKNTNEESKEMCKTTIEHTKPVKRNIIEEKEEAFTDDANKTEVRPNLEENKKSFKLENITKTNFKTLNIDMGDVLDDTITLKENITVKKKYHKKIDERTKAILKYKYNKIKKEADKRCEEKRLELAKTNGKLEETFSMSKEEKTIDDCKASETLSIDDKIVTEKKEQGVNIIAGNDVQVEMAKNNNYNGNLVVHTDVTDESKENNVIGDQITINEYQKVCRNTQNEQVFENKNIVKSNMVDKTIDSKELNRSPSCKELIELPANSNENDLNKSELDAQTNIKDKQKEELIGANSNETNLESTEKTKGKNQEVFSSKKCLTEQQLLETSSFNLKEPSSVEYTTIMKDNIHHEIDVEPKANKKNGHQKLDTTTFSSNKNYSETIVKNKDNKLSHTKNPPEKSKIILPNQKDEIEFVKAYIDKDYKKEKSYHKAKSVTFALEPKEILPGERSNKTISSKNKSQVGEDVNKDETTSSKLYRDSVRDINVIGANTPNDLHSILYTKDRLRENKRKDKQEHGIVFNSATEVVDVPVNFTPKFRACRKDFNVSSEKCVEAKTFETDSYNKNNKGINIKEVTDKVDQNTEKAISKLKSYKKIITERSSLDSVQSEKNDLVTEKSGVETAQKENLDDNVMKIQNELGKTEKDLSKTNKDCSKEIQLTTNQLNSSLGNKKNNSVPSIIVDKTTDEESTSLFLAQIDDVLNEGPENISASTTTKQDKLKQPSQMNESVNQVSYLKDLGLTEQTKGRRKKPKTTKKGVTINEVVKPNNFDIDTNKISALDLLASVAGGAVSSVVGGKSKPAEKNIYTNARRSTKRKSDLNQPPQRFTRNTLTPLEKELLEYYSKQAHYIDNPVRKRKLKLANEFFIEDTDDISPKKRRNSSSKRHSSKRNSDETSYKHVTGDDDELDRHVESFKEGVKKPIKNKVQASSPAKKSDSECKKIIENKELTAVIKKSEENTMKEKAELNVTNSNIQNAKTDNCGVKTSQKVIDNEPTVEINNHHKKDSQPNLKFTFKNINSNNVIIVTKKDLNSLEKTEETVSNTTANQSNTRGRITRKKSTLESEEEKVISQIPARELFEDETDEDDCEKNIKINEENISDNKKNRKKSDKRIQFRFDQILRKSLNKHGMQQKTITSTKPVKSPANCSNESEQLNEKITDFSKNIPEAVVEKEIVIECVEKLANSKIKNRSKCIKRLQFDEFSDKEELRNTADIKKSLEDNSNSTKFEDKSQSSKIDGKLTPICDPPTKPPPNTILDSNRVQQTDDKTALIYNKTTPQQFKLEENKVIKSLGQPEISTVFSPPKAIVQPPKKRRLSLFTESQYDDVLGTINKCNIYTNQPPILHEKVIVEQTINKITHDNVQKTAEDKIPVKSQTPCLSLIPYEGGLSQNKTKIAKKPLDVIVSELKHKRSNEYFPCGNKISRCETKAKAETEKDDLIVEFDSQGNFRPVIQMYPTIQPSENVKSKSNELEHKMDPDNYTIYHVLKRRRIQSTSSDVQQKKHETATDEKVEKTKDLKTNSINQEVLNKSDNVVLTTIKCNREEPNSTIYNTILDSGTIKPIDMTLNSSLNSIQQTDQSKSIQLKGNAILDESPLAFNSENSIITTQLENLNDNELKLQNDVFESNSHKDYLFSNLKDLVGNNVVLESNVSNETTNLITENKSGINDNTIRLKPDSLEVPLEFDCKPSKFTISTKKVVDNKNQATDDKINKLPDAISKILKRSKSTPENQLNLQENVISVTAKANTETTKIARNSKGEKAIANATTSKQSKNCTIFKSHEVDNADMNEIDTTITKKVPIEINSSEIILDSTHSFENLSVIPSPENNDANVNSSATVELTSTLINDNTDTNIHSSPTSMKVTSTLMNVHNDTDIELSPNKFKVIPSLGNDLVSSTVEVKTTQLSYLDLDETTGSEIVEKVVAEKIIELPKTDDHQIISSQSLTFSQNMPENLLSGDDDENYIFDNFSIPADPTSKSDLDLDDTIKSEKHVSDEQKIPKFRKYAVSLSPVICIEDLDDLQSKRFKPNPKLDGIPLDDCAYLDTSVSSTIPSPNQSKLNSNIISTSAQYDDDTLINDLNLSIFGDSKYLESDLLDRNAMANAGVNENHESSDQLNIRDLLISGQTCDDIPDLYPDNKNGAAPISTVESADSSSKQNSSLNDLISYEFLNEYNQLITSFDREEIVVSTPLSENVIRK